MHDRQADLRAGVVGGLEPKAIGLLRHRHRLEDRRGQPGGGDIPFAETLAAMGKTLGAAVGVPRETLDRHILGGKVVTGALT